jgi:dGTPase
MQQTTPRTLTELLSSRRIATAHFDEQIAFDGQQRSAFETDGDKIGFTEGFRALADKTQVHDRVERGGNHRNRLTHSIEVSRVGRSLGVALGARMISYYGLNAAPCGEAYWRVDPTDIGTIVSSACLAHDVGNPPFGHDGEDAIAEFFRNTETGQRAAALAGPEVGAELCLHEGNAQGFRMISRSMGWRQQGGLNLTAATLGAFGKYPFPIQPGKKKYGLHRADLETMEFVALATGMSRDGGDGWIRHPLAWLMEAADDICYLTVDLEDAAWIGMIPVETLCDLYRPVIGDDEIRRGQRMNDTPRMIQYFRSRMIKALINSCVEIYAEIARDIDEGTLGTTAAGGGILAHTRHAEAMQNIRTFSRDQIYRSKVTQDARQGFRKAMLTTMEALTSDLIDWIEHGNAGSNADDGALQTMLRKAQSPGNSMGAYRSLSELPHARLGTEVPHEASVAFPWLLDQITLMSDAQILDLSQRLRAG